MIRLTSFRQAARSTLLRSLNSGSVPRTVSSLGSATLSPGRCAACCSLTPAISSLWADFMWEAIDEL